MTPFCAAVDWGTSSFRLWLLARDGSVLAERRSAEGMMTAREAGFSTVLEGHLRETGAAASTPVIICGMAGARQGWKEAPYLDVPAGLDAMAALAARVDCAGRDVRILPGMAQRDRVRPDVMRGEETQLLGLAVQGTTSALVCLPGTHSKWVLLRNGRIEGFSTFMTGELFAVISQHTILRFALETEAGARPESPAFETAVKSAFSSPEETTANLFGLRARQLLGDDDDADSAARLSGLLIGLELAGTVARHGALDQVVLVSGGSLAALYGKAIGVIGASARLADAEEAVRAGLLSAAIDIWAEPVRT